jgi:serine/threonine protein kinase
MQSGYLLRNRYRIDKPLFAGGFGETYIAIDEDYPDKRRVVVKQLKPQSNDPSVLEIARRLFESEAATLAKLGEKTDRIPMLYAYFEERGEFYLVQEFIQGQTLTQELGNRRLSEAETLKIVTEILAGLIEVHRRNIIHRDLKPDNIIRRSSDRKLVLIDFGAVKAIRQTTVRISSPKFSQSIGIGTDGYMPTEQAMGYPTTASDIYAVGAIALQCLTGKHPTDLIDGATLEFKWRHLCQVSDRVATVLSKMVGSRHVDRYPTAMDANNALDLLAQPVNHQPTQQQQQQQPPTSHKPAPTIVSQTPIDRRKSLKLLGFVGVGMLCVIVIPKLFNSGDLKDANAYYERGNLKAYEKNDSQGALADYNRAIQLDPGFISAYDERGNLKADKLNDTQGALADYDRAIQISPTYARAYHHRGNLKIYRLNDPQGALVDYNRAIELEPKLADAYASRGVLKDQTLNDSPGGLKDLNKSIELDSKLLGGYYNRGDFYYSLGDKKSAIANFQKVVAIDKNSIYGSISQGIIDLEQGSLQQAIVNFDRAAQASPDDTPDIYKYRGLAHSRQGNKTSATQDWRKAFQIYEKVNTRKDRDMVRKWLEG